MDTSTNPQLNSNGQPSTGFSFPVTSVVDPVASVAPVGNPVVSNNQSNTTVVGSTFSTNQPIEAAQPSQIVPPTTFQPTQPVGTMSFTEQKPKSKTKDIFLVGLLLILLAGAVFGFTKVRSLLSSAAEDGCNPVEVTEQDLTANSIIVSFKTAVACKMQVAYGVDEILGLQMSEQILATDHRVKLSPLMPSTPYKYQIRHDETKYEPTRGFLTLPAVAAPTKAPVVVPTRTLTPVATTQPSIGMVKPTGTVTTVPTGKITPSVVLPAFTITPSVKYTIIDFQLHFGSVDPRFDTDKNGVVNIRDWQLYSK